MNKYNDENIINEEDLTAMLQEQQANIQMSAEAEMQKAQQKHQMDMEK